MMQEAAERCDSPSEGRIRTSSERTGDGNPVRHRLSTCDGRHEHARPGGSSHQTRLCSARVDAFPRQMKRPGRRAGADLTTPTEYAERERAT